jgi:hypothetical protein
VKKRLVVVFLVLLTLGPMRLAHAQESQRTPLLEVILTNYDTARTETLVYLRVFSDGSAEAHPMREIDFRTLALKKARLSSNDLSTLRELLGSSQVQQLDPEYSRYWGNKDFGHKWQIMIAQGDKTKSIVLENFEPFLARTKKKPYPVAIEKLGCRVWELRTKVTGEPLERNYLGGRGGCRELGY